MMPKVLKPFKSRLHRFAAGDDLPDGADLSPHMLDSLAEAGFVEGAAPEVAPKPTRSWSEEPADPEPASPESAE